MKRKTTEKFIEESKKIHGNKYDYSKSKYIDAHTKICIICPEHGEFWKEASSHLKGQGCAKCSYEERSVKMLSNTKEFISKAKKIHGNKYDYSKVEYINNNTKVCIICPEHGEFWQTPKSHLQGNECYKCGTIKIGNIKRKTKEQFISKARKIHGDKYDYSKVDYVNNATDVCIICPEHGEFYQTPSAHLRGCGCPICNRVNGSLKQRKTKEQFISKARKIHGDKYDYSKTSYVNAKTKICIICPKHGEFWQEPYSHLRGCGCPTCNESKLEFLTKETLTSLNIGFIEHCSKSSLKWLGRQHLDFYLPEYNIGIECQGIQHYKKDSFFGKGDKFKKIKERDKKKKTLCEENKVKLIYIPYNLSQKQIENKIKMIKNSSTTSMPGADA